MITDNASEKTRKRVCLHCFLMYNVGTKCIYWMHQSAHSIKNVEHKFFVNRLKEAIADQTVHLKLIIYYCLGNNWQKLGW